MTQRWLAGLTRGTALAALPLVACSTPQRIAPPPAEVTIVTVAPRSVDQVFELVGNVEASKSVAVRAQVAGILVAREFVEGTAVHAGQVLYRIDSTTYYADWQRAKAQLADAEARFANAEKNRTRMAAMLKIGAIAQRELDNADTEAKRSAAALDDTRAALDAAKKRLDDTVVRAELAGRIGKTHLEVGATVQGPGDILTTIDVLDPVYVTINPSGRQVLEWRRDPQAARWLMPGGGLKAEAVLTDGVVAPSKGKLTFIDPVVDPSTGTQQVRIEFPNRDQLLLPGEFVRVRLLGFTIDSAIVIPQRAVLQQLGHQTVYVVSTGDTVRVQEVEATGWTGEDWLIQSGLSPGDRVIVDGTQKVGPGSVVRPVPLESQ
jgi:membrane fusion protein (multidrug efflux system)